jgi:CRP-like cAMP-binding protein
LDTEIVMNDDLSPSVEVGDVPHRDGEAAVSHLLAESPLFKTVADPEFIKRLARRAKRQRIEAGSVVLDEGQKNERLHLIEDGQVEVLKARGDAEDSRSFFKIATLSSGDEFGSLSVLGDGIVKARIIAKAPCDIVSVDLSEDAKGDATWEHTRIQVLAAIGRFVGARLDDSNVNYVEHLNRQLEEERRRSTAGIFLMLIVSVLAIYTLFLKSISALPPDPLIRTIQTVFMVFVYLTPILYILWKGPFTRVDLGIRLAGGWRFAREAILYSIPVIGLMIAAKYALIETLPAFQSHEIFEVDHMLAKRQPDGTILWPGYLAQIGFYVLISPIQELIARCGLQSLIRETLYGPERFRVISAVIVSNLMFSAAHAHIHLGFAFSSFIGGLFWGWVFNRQNSLVGVSVSHFLVGGAAIYVLGLRGLFG